MIKTFKGRELKDGTLVQVYRNLHTGNFSIKCNETKLVLAHGTDFNLFDVVPCINESGRLRVIEEKQKNVHAYMIGVFYDKHEKLNNDEVVYNPYIMENFKTKKDDVKFIYAEKMYFTDNKCFI